MNELVKLLSPDHPLGAILFFILFVIIASILTRLFTRFMRHLLERGEDTVVDRMGALFGIQLGKLFIWLVAMMFYAHLVPSLDRLGTALLAGVSIVSIVIGMAAQSTLGNLISGISLLLYRPFNIGDRLQVNTPNGMEVGTVESVTLGYTVLCTFDNRRIVMANSVISTQVMVNLTSVDAKVVALVPISIGYEADIDKARAIILDLAGKHPATIEVVACPITNLGSSSIDFTLRVWCADSGAAFQIKTELLEQIKKRFDQEGIEIPYAYSNVIIRSVDAC
ncbi:MAG: mechanosensitive ion channel family protein [Pseudomonadales bacterium]